MNTANDPETWKVMGILVMGPSTTKEPKDAWSKRKWQSDVRWANGILSSLSKSDSLAELPDDRGRVRNRVRRDITSILLANHPFYINGGVYYNEQGDYSKAADFFEITGISQRFQCSLTKVMPVLTARTKQLVLHHSNTSRRSSAGFRYAWTCS